MLPQPLLAMRAMAVDDASDPAKRARLSQEERLQRSRERNRMHARRTRERKKLQMAELQERLDVMREKGIRLRERIEKHAMADVLLSIRSKDDRKPAADAFEITASKAFPYPYNGRKELSTFLARFIITGEEMPEKAEVRPPRRKEKLTREEREQIRRERNRVHAKRTRDRKKLMLEESENIIACMLEENQRMRTYLMRDCGVTLPDDLVYDLDAVSSSEDTDKDDKSSDGGDSPRIGALDIGASVDMPAQPAAAAAVANPAVHMPYGNERWDAAKGPAGQPGTLYPSVANKTSMFAHQAIFPSAHTPSGGGTIGNKRARSEDNSSSDGHTSDGASSDYSSQQRSPNPDRAFRGADPPAPPTAFGPALTQANIDRAAKRRRLGETADHQGARGSAPGSTMIMGQKPQQPPATLALPAAVSAFLAPRPPRALPAYVPSPQAQSRMVNAEVVNAGVGLLGLRPAPSPKAAGSPPKSAQGKKSPPPRFAPHRGQADFNPYVHHGHQ